MNRFLFFIFCISMMSAMPAVAAPDAQQKLRAVQQKLTQEEQRREKLERQAIQTEKDIQENTRKLVEVGREVQESERTLAALESEITPLVTRQQDIKTKLTQDRRDIARLVLALERLRRTPPEALIARPGAPLETAQTAMLMQNIVPVITRKTGKLKIDLRELQILAETLSVKRQKALAENQKHKKDQKNLSDLVAARRKEFMATNRDLKSQEASIRRMAREASNLEDLAARIDRNKKQTATKTVRLTPPPRAGRPQLPAAGTIKTAYGQKDDFGASSKGIHITTRSDALIVSPMGGVVRFAGPFKNYGNIVILEHEGGYHSLIAGLDKIDTVVGQSLAAGEAVGRMADDKNGGRTTLYYELRLNGQPVNPSRKFSGLG